MSLARQAAFPNVTCICLQHKAASSFVLTSTTSHLRILFPYSYLPYNIANMENSSDSITSLLQEAHDQPIPPKFTSYMTSHREILSDLINRQILLIRRRSADLNDSQITIYDKALLLLTRDGNDLTFQPAVYLFCKEYVGISEEDIEEAKLLLDQHSSLPNTMDQGKSSRQVPILMLTIPSFNSRRLPA